MLERPLGGLTAACIAVLLAVGCTESTEKGKLRPEGPPEILEVFMIEAATSDPQAMFNFNLAYGCEDPRTIDCNPDQIDNLPSDEQPRIKLCCDRQAFHREDDGKVDIALLGTGQKIRVVLDELLQGNTVEQFVCACADPPEALLISANCQGGPTSSLDPLNCEDNPATEISEASRFSDQNLDGVPDKTDLLPGVVEVYCDGLSTSWFNGADEGWWNPSGNQQVPANTQDSTSSNIVLEWEAVGPAVVLLPKGLPSNSTCHLRFTEETMYPTKSGMVMVPTGRDKDGQPVPEPDPPITFNTDVMRVVTSAPMDGATGVMMTLPLISVTFNTAISESTISNITITGNGGMAVAGVRSISTMDPATFEFVPSAPLGNGETITITITTSVTDLFGGTFPATETISFTTM